MHEFVYSIAAGILLTLAAGLVNAHPMTERFIPIGQSPGLSGTVTFIGTVDSVETVESIVRVRDHNQIHQAQVTKSTNIWLDRSSVGQSSSAGSFSDVSVGSRVEVKFRGEAPGGAAEWIKVQVQ